MLYHGSLNKFDKFDNDIKKRNTHNETNTIGIWLSNDIMAVKNFSVGVNVFYEESKTDFWNNGEAKKYAKNEIIKGYIYSVSLASINLKIFESVDKNIDSFHIFMDYRDQFCEYIGAKKGKQSWTSRYVLMNKEDANKEFIRNLKEQGFEGFIIKNTEYDAVDKNIDQYCIFNNEKIIIDSIVTIETIVNDAELEKLYQNSVKDYYRF